MRRGVIRVICLWAIVLSAGRMTYGAEFAGGTGEPNNPYLIETAEQLLGANFAVPGVYFRLSRDIDLQRREFDPPPYIRAHLDGAGFQVRNAVATMGASIFGSVEPEGTITNLTLVDCDIGMATEPGRPHESLTVAALATWNYGTISNCGAIGWIATWRVMGAGGLVGHNSGSIINCYFDGWITTNWEAEIDTGHDVSPYAGGLVCWNEGLIANSLARGYVVGRMGLGGLVGLNEGTIRDCYSSCMVIADVGGGGLVYENWGSLRNCYAMGQVTGEMRGGLVGMAGKCGGRASGCLWDMALTDCSRSGAGRGFVTLDSSWGTLALNGWAGDPNWVILRDSSSWGNYPRLAWEGTAGEPIAEYPFPLFRRGSGTQADPYVITDTDRLCLAGAKIYLDKHFILANDLDLRSVMDFLPIGICSGSSFSGSFDGNGHVIRNLSTDSLPGREATTWNFGLFGHVTGEVRNLTVENFQFVAGEHCCRMGLLAGTCEGVIKNCAVTGSIAVGENSQYIGELVGVNYGEIIDCQATATVKAGEGSTDIGGLMGADHPDPWE